MRFSTSLMLLAAIVAVNSGCSLFQNPIVGKWKCLRPDVKDKEVINYREFLSDGTLLGKVEYPKGEGLTQQWTGTWKAVEGNRVTTTEEGMTTTNTYKVDGNKFQWNPPDGVTCDRVK